MSGPALGRIDPNARMRLSRVQPLRNASVPEQPVRLTLRLTGLALAVCLQGCAAAAVGGAAVSVAATAAKTTVKVAGAAVGVGADVVGAAGRTVTGGKRN